MRSYPPFRNVIPHSKAGHPRVTHPFATLLAPCGAFAFDLHVLGTPPALILSQDQTLMLQAFALRIARIRGLAQDGTVLTRDRYGSALFQSVGHCGSPPIVSARTDSLDRSTLRRRTLTLILSDSARLRELRRDRVVCACT